MATTQYYGLLIVEGSSLIGALANDNPQKIDTALHNHDVDINALKARVPAPASVANKFLRDDGTWQDIPLPGQATSSALGTLKIGYTQNSKNYPLVLDSNGRAYVNVPWSDTTYPDATTSAHGLMTAADKTKLNGIESGAQKNPGAATTSANGLMSASDKVKLNGIESGAQKNPGNASQSAAGLMSVADKKKLDGIAAGAQVNPGVATTSANGLMPATDKVKLNGIESGAQKNPGNFGGATASKAGSAGLVPAPTAGGQYKVLYGEGGWATLQDLLNTTQAIAPNKVNNTALRLAFKWGTVSNVPAINSQASKLFDNAFPEACLCVFTQVASTHNGGYVRIRTYGWDKNGFGYQAQTAGGENVSFYYLAIGY